MKNLQIETVQRFKAGDCTFETVGEAQAYINRQKLSVTIFCKNKNLLEEFKIKEDSIWIPVEWTDKDTNQTFFDFLFEDGDGNSGIHWRGIFHCDSLKYVHDELIIIEWDYVWSKLNESLEDFPHMDVEDFTTFISAMTQKKIVSNTVENKSPFQIYDLFGKIRFNPVYIYD